MKTNTEASPSRLRGQLQRAATFGLLALAALLLQAREARAQWTQPDAQGNINNTNSGNVGVGTSAPAHKLDVNGNIYGANLFSAKRVFRDAFSNSGAAAVWYKIATLPVTGNSTGDLLDLRITGGRYDSINKFEMGVKMGNRNGFNAYVINAAGQVTERLYSRVVAYNNGGAVDVYLYLPGNAGFASYSSIGVEMTATGWGAGPTMYPTSAGVTATPPGTLVFDSSTAPVPLTISNAGNVGIGTTSPAYKMHVVSGTDTGTNLLHLDTGVHGGTMFGVAGHPNNESYFWINTYRAGQYFTRFQVDNFGRVSLQPNGGDVGIGTPAPAYRLDVQGGQINASGGLCIAGDCKTAWSQVGGGTSSQWTTSGTNIFYSAGNVGVGTASPGARLDVGAGAAARGGHSDVLIGAGGNNPQLEFYGATKSSAITHDEAAGGMIFYTNGPAWSPSMLITHSGNVGVGTSTPAAKLHVTGAARLDGATGRVYLGTTAAQGARGLEFIEENPTTFSIRHHDPNVAWRNIAINPYGGDVGVGTAAPRGRLEVAGGPLFLGDMGNPQWGNVVVRGRVFSASSNVHISPPGGFGVYIDSNYREAGGSNGAVSLHVSGDINAGGNITAKYQDVAEWVPSTQKLQAGTVVILDEARVNHVTASSSSYDTRVAGVVSARPGVLLGEGGDGKLMVATTGRVRVKVDATRAPIKVGDLLVTSDTEGVAMKSQPVSLGGRQFHSPGTIIGKALEPLQSGVGEILVLLSLQ